jgi:hypothetical protein
MADRHENRLHYRNLVDTRVYTRDKEPMVYQPYSRSGAEYVPGVRLQHYTRYSCVCTQLYLCTTRTAVYT